VAGLLALSAGVDAGSSWILVGFLVLLFALPLVMLATGALSWAVAKLVARSRIPPALRTRAGLWVPASIILVVLGLPTAVLLEGLSQDVRRAAAGSSATRPEMLARLALIDDVAPQVARNVTTPADSLRKLATSTRDDVREGVASNRSTPPDVLATLATDPVQRVRAVAESTLQQQRAVNSPPVGRPAPAVEPR
jgi:Leucine rich repeat variant